MAELAQILQIGFNIDRQEEHRLTHEAPHNLQSFDPTQSNSDSVCGSTSSAQQNCLLIMSTFNDSSTLNGKRTVCLC